MTTVMEVAGLRRAMPIVTPTAIAIAIRAMREENLSNAHIPPDRVTATKVIVKMKPPNEKNAKHDGHAGRLPRKKRGSSRSRKSNRSSKNSNRMKPRRKSPVVAGIRERKSTVIALITIGVDNLRLLRLRGHRN